MSSIEPGHARNALRTLAELTGPVPKGHWAVAVLSQVLAELEQARDRPDAAEVRCPACGDEVKPAFATDHRLRCFRDPSSGRLEWLADTLRQVAPLAAELGLETAQLPATLLNEITAVLRHGPQPRERRWYYLTTAANLTSALDFLARDHRPQYRSLVPGYVIELEAAVDTWERLLHREADPCPFCGAVLALDEALRHLHACDRAPAIAMADRAEAALLAALGEPMARALHALVVEREGFRSVLWDLLFESRSFQSGLGWNGTAAYADDHEEEDFGRAIDDAESFLERAARERGSPTDESIEATGLARRLRAEAAMAREATVRLLEACRHLTRSYGDDEWGRAELRDAPFDEWSSEVRRAQAVLDQLDPPRTPAGVPPSPHPEGAAAVVAEPVPSSTAPAPAAQPEPEPAPEPANAAASEVDLDLEFIPAVPSAPPPPAPGGVPDLMAYGGYRPLFTMSEETHQDLVAIVRLLLFGAGWAVAVAIYRLYFAGK